MAQIFRRVGRGRPAARLIDEETKAKAASLALEQVSADGAGAWARGDVATLEIPSEAAIDGARVNWDVRRGSPMRRARRMPGMIAPQAACVRPHDAGRSPRCRGDPGELCAEAEKSAPAIGLGKRYARNLREVDCHWRGSESKPAPGAARKRKVFIALAFDPWTIAGPQVARSLTRGRNPHPNLARLIYPTGPRASCAIPRRRWPDTEKQGQPSCLQTTSTTRANPNYSSTKVIALVTSGAAATTARTAWRPKKGAKDAAVFRDLDPDMKGRVLLRRAKIPRTEKRRLRTKFSKPR